MADTCTDLNARSCPVHGACTCPPDPEEWATIIVKVGAGEALSKADTRRMWELEMQMKIAADGCPLHGEGSVHAVVAASEVEAATDEPNPIADVLAGRSRYCVVHGDCLDVLRKLPEKCGVVLTDIPYGVGKEINGDKLPWEEWLPWVDERLAECVRVGRLAFSFFAATRLIRFIRETTVPPQFEINWHKPMMLHDTSLNGSPFLAHRESILYWGPTSPKEAGKLGYDSVAYNAMWPRERRAEGIAHPTPKPVALLARSIPYWTRPEDVIIDPFCGSGSHLIAALRTGHRAIGIDNDERWVAESLRRIEEECHESSLGAANAGQEALFAAVGGVR